MLEGMMQIRGKGLADALMRHGPRAANLLLGSAVAYTLAQLTWSLWPQPEVAAPPAAVVTSPAMKSAADGGLDRVVGLHLFGFSQPSPVSAAPVDAPETRLNLQLRGVLAADRPESTWAIIAQGSGEEKLYRIGDTVTAGVAVQMIHNDRVILRRNGRFETLRLPKEIGVGVAPAPEASAGEAPSTQGGLAQSVAEYRERFRENPQELLSLARIQPVMEGEQLKGYRLSPGKEPALFNRLGLRSGDIVTEVNGIAVTDTARAAELFNELSNAQRLNISLERRGSPTTISVNLAP